MASLRMLPIFLLLWAFVEAKIPVQDRLVEIYSQSVDSTEPLADNKDDDVDYRLPTHTKPIAYRIQLDPHFEEKNFSFTGKSEIDLDVSAETQVLKFHMSSNLEMVSSELLPVDKDGKEGKALVIDDKGFIKTPEFYMIHTKEPIKVGKYKLKLAFEGVLSDDLRGFYKSNYTDDEGKLKWLATTHFEPVGARRAFPCWDEPEYKATFTISIKHTSDYGVVSNMPVDKTGDVDKTDNRTFTHFKTSPKMSTYLVAFVVSDYGSKVHPKDSNFGVWTRKNALDRVDYALKVGKDELTVLDKFTNYPYKSMGTPKMDSISIPHFSAGAMENWGLVTYRESALLYKENVTTTARKQGIAAVISHEFAHQWFGNLVSPKWWTYLWLNEGFATYFQYYVTDQVEDNWRMMEQFVVKVLQQSALTSDAKEDTRPMNHEVQSPKQISSLFDYISYQKAGSVIRMMSHILTEDVFKAGLQSYLVAKKFDAATSDDLFENLQAAAIKSKLFPKDFSVKTIMDTWVTQKGYPVVTVNRDYLKSKALVTQERFVINTTKVQDDIKWWVPLNHVMQDDPNFNDTEPTHWLKPTDKFIEIKLENDTTQWVIFNKQQTGYYRVNYDLENWQLIINQLNSTNYTQIHVLNRAQLIDDALNLARSGRLDYSVALDLTTYLDKETDYIPWVSAFSGFAFIDAVLKHSTHYEKFQRYMQRELAPTMKHLGFEGSPEHINKLHRAESIQSACYYGLKECHEFAKEEFEQWLKDGTTSSTDTKNTVLCTALRTADVPTWQKVLTRYTNSTDEEERQLLLPALACSSNKEILNTYLSMAMMVPSHFKEPEQVIFAINQNSYIGVPVVLEYLTDHIDLVKNATEGRNVFKSIVTDLGRKATTEEHLYKLTSFIVNMDEPNSDAQPGIETALTNLRLIKSLTPKISLWLDKHNFGPIEEGPDGASTLALTTLLAVVTFMLTRIY